MILYLTSSPTGSYRAEKAPSFQGLNPENRLVENLKADWKERSRCLLLCADPDAYMKNNEMRFFVEKAVKESGLTVSAFDGATAVMGRRWRQLLILMMCSC